MIEHAFYKNASASMKGCVKKYFEELGPVPQREITKFEAPIQSIRRVIGEKFYEMDDKKEDIIHIEVSDEATFNLDAIKADNELGNFTIMNNVATFVVAIFTKFAQMYGNNVIGPDFSDVKFKVAVTSASKGMICKELSIADFAPLSLYDDAGNVIGFKNMNELSELNGELTAADEAVKKLRSTGGTASNAAVETLVTKINDLNKKLISKYIEIIETFFNLIKTWGEVENVADVFDATFVFNIYIVDNEAAEGEQKSIVEMDVLTMHDIAHRHYMNFKRKFD